MGSISIAVRRQPAQIELPYVHPNHFVSVSAWPSGGKAELAAPPSLFRRRPRPPNNQGGDAARPLPINPEWPGIHKKVDEQISLWMDSGWAADMKLSGSSSYGCIPGRVQVPALDSCNYGLNQGPPAGPNICLRSLHMNTEWEIERPQPPVWVSSFVSGGGLALI